jgi:hypothetical protein
MCSFSGIYDHLGKENIWVSDSQQSKTISQDIWKCLEAFFHLQNGRLGFLLPLLVELKETANYPTINGTPLCTSRLH